MLAFHNDPDLKDRKLAQVQAHEAADEIVKGLYWENGKGCAVGCTVHSGDCGAYETEMGIPQMLARLEDHIFEGMSNEAAKRSPVRFIMAVRPGADLTLVGWKFLHWLVVDVVGRHGTDNVKAATVDAIDVLRRRAAGETVSSVDARNAARVARSVYAAAAAVAASYEKAYDRQAEKLLELIGAE